VATKDRGGAKDSKKAAKRSLKEKRAAKKQKGTEAGRLANRK
jgi:hypothetical protein